MGVCKSKTNYRKVGSISEKKNPSEPKLDSQRAAVLSIIITNAQNITDAANDKLDTLQRRFYQHKLINDNLQKQMTLVQNAQTEKEVIMNQYKAKLDAQRSAILERENKIQLISKEIANIKQQSYGGEHPDYFSSINDKLYKVNSTNTAKLKWSNETKKCVVFTDTINCLCYYDKTGVKHMNVYDISIDNNSIQNKMDKPWFLVIGEKRNALFVADNISIRNKWVNFIRESLNEQVQNNYVDLMDYQRAN